MDNQEKIDELILMIVALAKRVDKLEDESNGRVRMRPDSSVLRDLIRQSKKINL